jgi:hypothetical protein
MKPSRRGFFALFAALPAAGAAIASKPAGEYDVAITTAPSIECTCGSDPLGRCVVHTPPCPNCGARRVTVWSPTRPWTPPAVQPCDACSLRGLTIRYTRRVDSLGNIHNRVDARFGPMGFDPALCRARYAEACGGHQPG